VHGLAARLDQAGAAPAGIERLEAYFAGHGYDPHRHDTYAIGVTLSGVQLFDYRGHDGAQPSWAGPSRCIPTRCTTVAPAPRAAFATASPTSSRA
jgi:hypothetical protein